MVLRTYSSINAVSNVYRRSSDIKWTYSSPSVSGRGLSVRRRVPGCVLNSSESSSLSLTPSPFSCPGWPNESYSSRSLPPGRDPDGPRGKTRTTTVLGWDGRVRSNPVWVPHPGPTTWVFVGRDCGWVGVQESHSLTTDERRVEVSGLGWEKPQFVRFPREYSGVRGDSEPGWTDRRGRKTQRSGLPVEDLRTRDTRSCLPRGRRLRLRKSGEVFPEKRFRAVREVVCVERPDRLGWTRNADELHPEICGCLVVYPWTPLSSGPRPSGAGTSDRESSIPPDPHPSR